MTDDDILRAIRSHPDPFVSLPEIAGDVSRSKETLRRRLHDLADRGRVKKKRLGSRAIAWWLPEDEPETVPGDD